MDPKQNTNQPQIPNVPAQPGPVANQVPSSPQGPGKSNRGIFIALILVLAVVSGGMLYFVFGMPGTKKPEALQTQIQPTAVPTPQTEEEQLEEVIVASPEADFSDLEKDLESL